MKRSLAKPRICCRASDVIGKGAGERIWPNPAFQFYRPDNRSLEKNWKYRREPTCTVERGPIRREKPQIVVSKRLTSSPSNATTPPCGHET
jgi:hypothetical protein